MARKELAIPNRPRTHITSGFHLEIKRQVAAVQSHEDAYDGLRKLLGWRAYVTNRQQREELERAARWCELRLGELLGEPEPGRPKKTSPASEVFLPPKDECFKFRKLAAHRELVEPLIMNGTHSRAKLLAAIKEAEFVPPAAATKTYSVLLADPPWAYDFAEGESRSIEKEYPTMTAEELRRLDVPAGKNSVLYMWATAPKLEVALSVLASWGFTYKTCAIWDKELIGMGYWFRGQHELLLVGTKGSFSPPPAEHRVSSVIRSKRTKHSAKPEAVYLLIEKAFPKNRKVELFARKARPRWDAWGNEVQ